MSNAGVFIPGQQSISEMMNPEKRNNIEANYLLPEYTSTMQLCLITHSTKGGVGKTTIAKNLAYAFASLGKKVLLVDSNSDGNVAEQIGSGHKYSIDDFAGFENTESLDPKLAMTMLAEDTNNKIHFIASGYKPNLHPSAALLIMRTYSRLFEVIIVDTETKLTTSVFNFMKFADKILLIGNNNPNIYPRLKFRLSQLLDTPSRNGRGGLGLDMNKIDLIVNMRKKMDIKHVSGALDMKITRVFDYDEKVEITENSAKSSFHILNSSKFTKEMTAYAKSLLSEKGFTYSGKPESRKWGRA